MVNHHHQGISRFKTHGIQFDFIGTGTFHLHLLTINGYNRSTAIGVGGIVTGTSVLDEEVLARIQTG